MYPESLDVTVCGLMAIPLLCVPAAAASYACQNSVHRSLALATVAVLRRNVSPIVKRVGCVALRHLARTGACAVDAAAHSGAMGCMTIMLFRSLPDVLPYACEALLELCSTRSAHEAMLESGTVYSLVRIACRGTADLGSSRPALDTLVRLSALGDADVIESLVLSGTVEFLRSLWTVVAGTNEAAVCLLCNIVTRGTHCERSRVLSCGAFRLMLSKVNVARLQESLAALLCRAISTVAMSPFTQNPEEMTLAIGVLVAVLNNCHGRPSALERALDALYSLSLRVRFGQQTQGLLRPDVRKAVLLATAEMKSPSTQATDLAKKCLDCIDEAFPEEEMRGRHE
eukprot:m51a1_g5781 hypothetical protein (342) ;mRNA; f:1261835-1262860